MSDTPSTKWVAVMCKVLMLTEKESHDVSPSQVALISAGLPLPLEGVGRCGTAMVWPKLSLCPQFVVLC